MRFISSAVKECEALLCLGASHQVWLSVSLYPRTCAGSRCSRQRKWHYHRFGWSTSWNVLDLTGQYDNWYNILTCKIGYIQTAIHCWPTWLRWWRVLRTHALPRLPPVLPCVGTECLSLQTVRLLGGHSCEPVTQHHSCMTASYFVVASQSTSRRT